MIIENYKTNLKKKRKNHGIIILAESLKKPVQPKSLSRILDQKIFNSNRCLSYMEALQYMYK